MGKYKSIVLLGAAVIVALITSMLVYSSLQNRSRKALAMRPQTQPVAVAVTDLAWGTLLTREMIKTVPYLQDNLPYGTSSDPASLAGRVLVYPVKSGEPIFESRLAPTTLKTGGVAAIITPRKRAVAVKVDQVIGVAGFINPGNRVDVLVTISPYQSNKSGPVTKIVLENILVLAAGPEVVKGREPTNVTVITLEVTPEEAERLALGASEGKLQLALRNYNDTGGVSTKGTTVPILLTSYGAGGKVGGAGYTHKSPSSKKWIQNKNVKKSVSKQPAIHLAENRKETIIESKPHVVEIIKGIQVSEVTFEKEENSK